MDRFSYCLPTHFEFGEDAELEVGRLVSRFSGTKALIVLGEGSARRSGLFTRVRTSLDRALLEYAVLSGCNRHLSLSWCERVSIWRVMSGSTLFWRLVAAA